MRSGGDHELGTTLAGALAPGQDLARRTDRIRDRFRDRDRMADDGGQ